MRRAAAIAALALGAAPAYAITAGDLVERVQRDEATGTPIAYGFVIGVLDAWDLSDFSHPAPGRVRFCIPDDVSADDVVLQALRYIRDRTFLHDKLAAEIVIEGVASRWPCLDPAADVDDPPDDR